VIHVATVHHKSNKWIDIQLAYLRRHLHEPYRVVANLEGVPGDHGQKFDRVIPARGRHAGKLNFMASEIVAEARADDLIMFIDGDAFPIADPMPTVHKALDETVLIAVRREENGEDKQPHPSFCVVRAGDWDRLRGDWSMGHCWEDQFGELVSDSGGNLLAALERAGAPWTPIVRSNRVNPHPLWFAVYGDIIYHHGAGFRIPVARSISAGQPPRWYRGERLPVVGKAIRKVDSARIKTWEDRQMAASRRLGESIFAKLEADPEFYRQFLETGPARSD
jgi:hypothetical protein